uniref:Uncharacterized protein n=1 Tax=Rhizophora mucronata TaxID=61149 RepID=A0A2P2N5Y2_RHIMU
MVVKVIFQMGFLFRYERWLIPCWDFPFGSYFVVKFFIWCVSVT